MLIPFVLQKSGLIELFLEICRPGNLLETTHPDVELSFRFYSWRVSYGELLCRWTDVIHVQALVGLMLLPSNSED